MDNHPSTPKILVVTPEVACVRYQAEEGSQFISARAGGLGDICATQIHGLYENGLDVHLAIPNYRNVFKRNVHGFPDIDIGSRQRTLPKGRIHLAQDRSFYYRPVLFTSTNWDNVRMSLAFQREVIHRIIPEVQPDLIHCYDWMTGLIPAMARRYGIPCLFSLYRLNSPNLLLSTIEERGIDIKSFWQYCYYQRMPVNYQETRNGNPLDMLASGVFAANMAITMSHSYQEMLTDDTNPLGSPSLTSVLRNKGTEGRCCTVPSIPDPSFDPKKDIALIRSYGPESHYSGKLFNKLQLQEALKLPMDSTVPLCFWPTRLDSSRFGFTLMRNILPDILDKYREQRLQIVFVADGDQQEQLCSLIERIGAKDRSAVCDFDAGLHRLAYGGADFVLMPLKSDPCALPCKIGQRYGALPIAYDAGAIHDCVEHLHTEANVGNGFLFKHFDAIGFLWAMDQAMNFYRQSVEVRSLQVQRIMAESLRQDGLTDSTRPTIDLYQRMMDRFSISSQTVLDANSSSHPEAA